MWNTKVRRWIKPTAGLLVLGGLTWAGVSYDLSRYVSLEQVRSMVQSLGAYGPVAFVGLCVGAVLLHLPEIVLIAIGGVLFGSVNGGLDLLVSHRRPSARAFHGAASQLGDRGEPRPTLVHRFIPLASRYTVCTSRILDKS